MKTLTLSPCREIVDGKYCGVTPDNHVIGVHHLQHVYKPEVDFEEAVHADLYRNLLPFGPDKAAKTAYRDREGELYTQFMTDLRKWLVHSGVPEKYADKVARHAWQDGHSSGYHEVLNCGQSLIEIFQ